ncbi:hypothetical protein ABPG74_021374 [Tetrahymena malaccensis]
MQEDVDQERLLDQARQKVKEQAYFMKKSLDQVNLRDGLRHASTMLEELGVREQVQLNPKNYYIVFMQIFDELRTLEQYFKEEYRRGRKMMDLYESVQHATKLIPRLYLLITVGSVYIQTHEVGAKEILLDLLEMIKAVQHPTRGLFLRYYFLKMCKDRLPDKDSEYFGEGGDVDDCINIITRNLNEMNKLWIRMSGKSRDKPRREKERVDLKITVGENIHRLSSLEGVNSEIYQTTVLPKLLDLIVSSKDAISQNYLIDCVISCFPDEYHLITLHDILGVCTTQLEPKVDIKSIFISLMDRLAEYALRSEDVQATFNSDNHIYSMFKNNIDNLVERSSSTEFKNVLDLMVAFLKFSLRCYSSNSDYVNQILKSCVKICEKQHEQDFQDDCLKNIVKFLTMPLETMSLSILTMDEYPNLMKYLPFSKRRQVAQKITQAVVSLKRNINDQNIAEQLVLFIHPLLVTEKDYIEVSQNDFEEEQNLVCKMLHLVHHDDAQEYWNILRLFFDNFQKGEIKRQRFTYPTMFYALAKFTRQVYEKNQQNEVLNFTNIFEIMKQLIETLAQEYHSLALKLYIQFILIINEFDHEKTLDEFTYDIATTALTIYQDDLGDADVKLQAIQVISGALNKISCLSEENYDTLSSNTTQYSAKLLKKQDQVLSILNCTHLFHGELIKDEESVKKCLKKAIKIAQTLLKTQNKSINLYIYILNRYFVFWNYVQFDVAEVQELINTINEKIGTLEKSNETEALQKYWRNTVQYIKSKQEQNTAGFAELHV